MRGMKSGRVGNAARSPSGPPGENIRVVEGDAVHRGRPLRRHRLRPLRQLTVVATGDDMTTMLNDIDMMMIGTIDVGTTMIGIQETGIVQGVGRMSAIRGQVGIGDQVGIGGQEIGGREVGGNHLKRRQI